MHVAMDIDIEVSGDTKTNEALDSKTDVQQESIPAAAAPDKETIAFFPDQGTVVRRNGLCCITLSSNHCFSIR